jgi:membrane-associated phospholipid phosphatase
LRHAPTAARGSAAPTGNARLLENQGILTLLGCVHLGLPARRRLHAIVGNAMKLRGAPVVFLGLLLAYAPRAHAQAAPDHQRSRQYYAVHGTIVGALFAGSVATHVAFHPSAGQDFGWFPGDASLRGRRSVAAAELSNSLITLTVAAPVFTEVGRGVDAHFANFGVVYSEALTANLLLNGISKLAFRRPRPYSYGVPEAQDLDPRDRNVSFYSGHSSTAFTAAVAGSLLFAESAPNRAAKLVLWGSELALAGATANLRIRAGKHYYSDVVVGSLVGIGLGVLVPVLHGGSYAPEGVEYLAASGGLVAGVLVSQLMPLHIDAQPVMQASVTWSVAPWASPAAAGLSANGAF